MKTVPPTDCLLVLDAASLETVCGGDLLNWLPSDGDETDSFDSFCPTGPITTLWMVNGDLVPQSPDAMTVRPITPGRAGVRG